VARAIAEPLACDAFQEGDAFFQSVNQVALGVRVAIDDRSA